MARDRIEFWTRLALGVVWHPVLFGKNETACGVGLEQFQCELRIARLGHADEECSVCAGELATTIIAGPIWPEEPRWRPSDV